MQINIITTDTKSTMNPLTITRTIGECQIAGTTLKKLLLNKFAESTFDKLQLTINDDLWPSAKLAEKILTSSVPLVLKGNSGRILAYLAHNNSIPETENVIEIDTESMIITYPWDIIAINEEVVGNLKKNTLNGTVWDGAVIDGYISLGENSVLLPGVYIEGNAVIGTNCKIGPNCYIRGNTSIGDNCHIGQAVEIKNSVLMNNVGAGHLSYVGDSIIGENSNLGAGTITANFRHDGKNHRSAVDGIIIDTGRRKFGTIMGDDVHTGIHTSIYPGRKIWPHMSTLPGCIVKKDIVHKRQEYQG